MSTWVLGDPQILQFDDINCYPVDIWRVIAPANSTAPRSSQGHPVTPKTMTPIDLYTYIHSGTRAPQRAWRSRWTSFGLVAAVAVATAIFGIPTTALAKPMPSAQEQVIAEAAQIAIDIFDSNLRLSTADRNEVFGAHVADIARQAALFLGVDVQSMQQAWMAADLAHQRALINGLTQLGVPYKVNAAIENVAFDCSGLVAFAWGKAGVALSRGSSAQFASAKPVKAEEAQLGDLIWRPGHISMYLGVPSAVLQTPYSGRSVELQMMNNRISSWVKYANPLI